MAVTVAVRSTVTNGESETRVRSAQTVAAVVVVEAITMLFLRSERREPGDQLDRWCVVLGVRHSLRHQHVSIQADSARLKG